MNNEKYVELDKLLGILDSTSGKLAFYLDQKDGVQDGYIEPSLWNEWLKKHNLSSFVTEPIPVIEAIDIIEQIRESETNN